MTYYYLVTCKCGHFGPRYYIPICFPIVAENGREAAAIARMIPRCKHHHKDAILSVIKTDYEGYVEQYLINSKDPYLLCHSKHEQNQIMPLIEHRLVLDNHINERSDKHKYLNRKPNLLIQAKKYIMCCEDFI